MSLIITLSGPIGSRRSEIADQLAERLQWRKVRFSNIIRNRIRADGGDETDRTLLQTYGQALVQDNLATFVRDTLTAADGNQEGNIIVDGLRHVEVLINLREQAGDRTVFYVHIDPDLLKVDEAARLRDIAEQDLYRYDSDLTEAQISRILPAYADLRLEGRLGPSMNATRILERIKPLQNER